MTTIYIRGSWDGGAYRSTAQITRETLGHLDITWQYGAIFGTTTTTPFYLDTREPNLAQYSLDNTTWMDAVVKVVDPQSSSNNYWMPTQGFTDAIVGLGDVTIDSFDAPYESRTFPQTNFFNIAHAQVVRFNAIRYPVPSLTLEYLPGDIRGEARYIPTSTSAIRATVDYYRSRMTEANFGGTSTAQVQDIVREALNEPNIRESNIAQFLDAWEIDSIDDTGRFRLKNIEGRYPDMRALGGEGNSVLFIGRDNNFVTRGRIDHATRDSAFLRHEDGSVIGPTRVPAVGTMIQVINRGTRDD